MDDKYGYKSLLLRLCSPDRFDRLTEPEKEEPAVELLGYLNKIEWNDIYDLSKIRKRAKNKLGVDVDVAELYSRLMEVFSPEKYKKRGYDTEKVKRYAEICRTLTAAKDDINLLESELYDIAKMDVDLWNEPEPVQPEPQTESVVEEVAVEDSLPEEADEMPGGEEVQVNDVLIAPANGVTVKKFTDDDGLMGEVFEPEYEVENVEENLLPMEWPVSMAETKVEPKTETKEETNAEPKGIKPPVLDNPNPRKQGMFSHPFSFKGRIRRAEYWLSWVVAWIVLFAFSILLVEAEDDDLYFLVILLILGYVAVLWFLLAQRTKRCHDIGSSGWAQLIPFYELWILFENSEAGENEYGDCPKKM